MSVLPAPIVAAAAVFALMGLETWRSASNDRGLRAAGAVEPPGDVYRLMAVSYPGAFAVMTGEALLAGTSWTAAGLAVLILAKVLKYWAIGTLGRRWSFRVLVPPQSTRVTGGPYRWVSHPNYVAVAGELVGYGLLLQTWRTGPLVTLWFIWLMWRRIRVEEAALTGRSVYSGQS